VYLEAVEHLERQRRGAIHRVHLLVVERRSHTLGGLFELDLAELLVQDLEELGS